jgi:hypothetical protein
MKKILIYAICLLTGLSLKAQHLYVQPVDGSEQIVFPLEHSPKITFEAGTKTIESAVTSQTFELNNVQNLSFTFSPSTSVAENLEEGKIHLYPNPVKDELTLTLDIPTEDLRYRIFDMTGKQQTIGPIRSETTQINMQNFRSSIYILHIDRNGQPVQSFKIVKQ